LLTIVVAAVAPIPSSYSCYTNGTTAPNDDMFAQVRGGVFTPLANASALIPLLAHIVCPVAHPSQEMVGQLCAAGVGLQMKRQAKVHEDLSGFTESCVGACPRWPVGQWAHWCNPNLRVAGEDNQVLFLLPHLLPAGQRNMAGFRRWARACCLPLPQTFPSIPYPSRVTLVTTSFFCLPPPHISCAHTHYVLCVLGC
jgi:hypothetical protein